MTDTEQHDLPATIRRVDRPDLDLSRLPRCLASRRKVHLSAATPTPGFGAGE
jgi:hypothetical protein